jgi:hypothetical protein
MLKGKKNWNAKPSLKKINETIGILLSTFKELYTAYS